MEHDSIFIGWSPTLKAGDYITDDADFAINRRRENARATASALALIEPVDWPTGLPFVWDDQTIMKATTCDVVTDLEGWLVGEPTALCSTPN